MAPVEAASLGLDEPRRLARLDKFEEELSATKLVAHPESSD